MSIEHERMQILERIVNDTYNPDTETPTEWGVRCLPSDTFTPEERNFMVLWAVGPYIVANNKRRQKGV